jgi:hypothetical protein
VKISASSIELGFEDDFWDNNDSVFVNGLSVRSSLFAQKMSALAVELGFFDDFLGPRVLVFVNGFEDDVWDTRDSVFFNGLSFNSSPCA